MTNNSRTAQQTHTYVHCHTGTVLFSIFSRSLAVPVPRALFLLPFLPTAVHFSIIRTEIRVLIFCLDLRVTRGGWLNLPSG